MINNFLNRILKHKEALIIIAVLAISGYVHAKNMFGFPYFENDEGTYMSQAWSLLSQGKLSPYTYWYDHAPGGWIFTSVWLLITGGIYSFGYSLNSGRVFMLVLHLFSTFFLLHIGKKLSGNIWTGVFAALIFSLSPLGLYFQRRLLLDNIMVFWVLMSYFLLLVGRHKLSSYILSAICFGIAILTKENAIFFIPGFLLLIYREADKHNRNFAIMKWLIVAGSVVFLYFLFAFLQKELFQSGTLLGGTNAHVSLLETLKYQSSRPGGDFFDTQKSSFWLSFKLWLKQDWFVIGAGIFSTMILLLMSLFMSSKRKYLSIVLLSVLFIFFLLRGGLVIEFYIVPFIPILSLLISICVFELFSMLMANSKKRTQNLGLFLMVCVLFLFYSSTNQISKALNVNGAGNSFFDSNQTSGQKNAIDWIRRKIPTNAVIVFDDYSHLELNDPRNPSGIYYPNAAWYWKFDLDLAVRNRLIPNGPSDIDYIAKTPQMQFDISLGAVPLVGEALKNSGYAESFNTSGWGVEIWATRYPSKILRRSWEYYKKRFIIDGSHSVDPSNGLTTSEGQSYALLRAVWMNDKTTFDDVWNWTKNNLANSNGTFSWKWGQNQDGEFTTLDSSSASDADTDIALALSFASKQWNNTEYLSDSKVVLNGIWATEVKDFLNSKYLVAGDWADDKDVPIINPSYLSPYAYKIFAEVDMDHDWATLVESSYEVLERCMTATFEGQSTSTNLPPNWCSYDKSGNAVSSPENGLNSTEYSYDAVRTLWRLSVDYKWFGDVRAKRLLDLSGAFLKDKWASDGKILVGYTHDGRPWEDYESVLGYSTSLSNFTVIDSALADTIYKTKVLDKFYEDFKLDQHYWEDPNNYYIQNWGWFGTALYSNNLPNLWNR